MRDDESTMPRDRPATGAGADGGAGSRRSAADPLFQVRTSDMEPYTGLGYLSKLFRFIAVILLILLVAEVVTGLSTEGSDAVSTLVNEGSRLIVLAGLLWGAGDLATLLIDVGHDVRAARIFLGRLAAHRQAFAEQERGAPRPSDRQVSFAGAPGSAAARGDADDRRHEGQPS